jgi:hypothetical protein
MSASKTFSCSDHSTCLPQTGDGCRDDRSRLTALAGIAPAYEALQAELWECSVPSTCNCVAHEQASSSIDDAGCVSCPKCAMAKSAETRAVPTRGGACYLRNADATAESDSLTEQLDKVLRQARSHGVWIPRSRVFADVGSTHDGQLRPGLMSLVSLISDDDTSVTVIYVDDFSRLDPCHGQHDLVCHAAQLCGKTVYSVAERPAA